MDYGSTYRWCLAGKIAVVAWLAVVPMTGSADDEGRGRLLHDTHCISCHGTSVYKRDGKLGKDYETIRSQVVRWQTNVSLKWSEADIDAVTTYLARTFYKVPCPAC